MAKLNGKLLSFALFLGMISIVATIPGCKDRKATDAAFVKDTPEIFVQMGHSGTISSVAFSPDGVYALSGSADHTVKLWEISTGRLVRTVRGSEIGIRGEGPIKATFSPNGRDILAGSWDGDIVVLDLNTGRIISAFVHPAMSSMAFSPDGKFVLSAGYEGAMKLWSRSTGDEVETYEVSSYGVASVAFSADGTYILSGDQGGGLQIRNVETTDLTMTFKDEQETSAIFSVAFSPDGVRAAAVNSAGNITVWDVRTGRKLRQISTGAIFDGPSMAFSRDGKYVALGGGLRDTIALWNLDNGEIFRTFAGQSGFIDAMVLSSDGSSILSGGSDKTVRLLNVATGDIRATFGGLTRHAAAVACSPAGNKLLAGSVQWFGKTDITVTMWDAAHGLLTKQLKAAASSDIAFSPDCRFLYSQGALWDIESGSKIQELSVTAEARTSLFSPDGKFVLSGDHGGTVTLWDITERKQMLSFKAHNLSVSALAFSGDGQYFATGDNDNTDNLKIWNLNTGQHIRTFEKSVEFISAIAFTPDGRYLMSGNPSTNAILRLWDVATGEVARTFSGHTNDVYTIAISADGKYALSGGLDATIRLWDIATGEALKTFSGHTSKVRSVAFSGDGTRAVSSSDDGTTRVWNVSTGEEIAQFIGFEDGEWVVITPEGFFNASPQGAQHLTVRIGNEVYSVDNLFEKFFNPVYVASLLGGRTVVPVADIRKGVLAPPLVRIISPGPDTKCVTDTLTIAVSAKDMTGGIGEIRLYHNGKAIGEETRGMKAVTKADEAVRTYAVNLVDGRNIFRAIAFSSDGTESKPYELVVTLTAPKKDVSLHVVAVGINEYKNRALNLNYAEPDARGIADFFRRAGRGLYKTVDVNELYNEQATKERVLSALGALQGTGVQDVVVIYLAGHGDSRNDQWYFMPHELAYPERDEDVKTQAISSDELRRYVKAIRAQKILMLIDACKSGAALVAFRGFEDRKALSQLSRSAGVHIVAASTRDQFAAEVKELGHGVFTHTLLAGLNGKAAGTNESVTVRKLMWYVEENLPEVTRKYKQEAQYPVVDSRGMDFPLVIAR
jgi:WD40 repeat protein